MAKALKQIGSIACPCCAENTPVKEQSNGLAMITCSWCDVKIQAFSSRSDRVIRSRMKPHAAPENTPAPPENTPTPAAQPTPAANPAAKKDWFQ
jgi:hypothetical protein